MEKQKVTSQAEKTKQTIVQAAETLFAKHGFANVTMRQIAKHAGCSHTAIYLYFKDKQALLHELSVPHLQRLQSEYAQLLQRNDISPKQTLIQISEHFILYCLLHRNLFTILFLTEAERVDEKQPSTELNRLRIALFEQLKQAIKNRFQVKDEEQLLECARIYFFLLHGIIGTYVHSEEPVDQIIKRLLPTFNDAIECMIIGLEQKINEIKRS